MVRRAKILVTFSAEAHADEKSGTGSYSTKRGTFGVERFHVTCVSTILAVMNFCYYVATSSFHIIDPSFLVIFARGESFAEKYT